MVKEPPNPAVERDGQELRFWPSLIFTLAIQKGSMKQLILMALLVILVPLESNADENNECLYNQDAFIAMYAPIKKKYPHTKFLKREQALEINLPDSKVIVRYFGCEHYGTKIKYFVYKMRPYTDKEIFDKTVDLLDQFGQERIDPNVLNSLLKKGKYERIENRTFIVNYQGMDEFAITVDGKVGKPLIEISFYN